jgi:hypothetical protein
VAAALCLVPSLAPKPSETKQMLTLLASFPPFACLTMSVLVLRAFALEFLTKKFGLFQVFFFLAFLKWDEKPK